MSDNKTNSNLLDNFHNNQKKTLVDQLTNPDKVKLLCELYDKIQDMQGYILHLEWRIVALEKQNSENNM